VAKDLAVALAVRGNALLTKHNNDKAIEAFTAAHDAGPDNPGIVDARGLAYERKGQDDLAMADYNLALQMCPNFAASPPGRDDFYFAGK
jgi:Flp pilus assembly protein TadD